MEICLRGLRGFLPTAGRAEDEPTARQAESASAPGHLGSRSISRHGHRNASRDAVLLAVISHALPQPVREERARGARGAALAPRAWAAGCRPTRASGKSMARTPGSRSHGRGASRHRASKLEIREGGIAREGLPRREVGPSARPLAR